MVLYIAESYSYPTCKPVIFDNAFVNSLCGFRKDAKSTQYLLLRVVLNICSQGLMMACCPFATETMSETIAIYIWWYLVKYYNIIGIAVNTVICILQKTYMDEQRELKHALRSGPCFNIKTVFTRYGDSRVKDKMVARPSYL